MNPLKPMKLMMENVIQKIIIIIIIIRPFGAIERSLARFVVQLCRLLMCSSSSMVFLTCRLAMPEVCRSWCHVIISLVFTSNLCD
jgi:hypothetical protein